MNMLIGSEKDELIKLLADAFHGSFASEGVTFIGGKNWDEIKNKEKRMFELLKKYDANRWVKELE